MNEEKAKGYGTLAIVAVVIVIVVLIASKGFEIINSIFSGLGIIDDKKEKENEIAIVNTVDEENKKTTNSFWSPTFYTEAPGNATLFTPDQAKNVALQFWDSVGYVYDTPSKGAAAMRRIYTGAQLSQVVYAFGKQYGLDLLSWLQNKYNTSEQKEILKDMLSYSSRLPKYYA